MQLAADGFLDEYGVKLLGADPETIHKAEDRQAFKDTMEKIGEPCIPSKVVETVADALAFADNEIGYPVIVRPAFTLGGTGGGIAYNREELLDISTNGLRLSPITQILIEKNISGWKEIEFEVIRDAKGNVITVCSMENFDPVGVHTGDSIVVAPALTLADKEYQMLRSASLNIITELKVEGGCNVQLALEPESFRYAVIEVNPRVSRSSALASKATGYPIAKVAAKIAIGYTLDEIINAVTGKTYACFEPTLDYVVLKFPKWPFDKFVYAKRTLGTQMMATGEIMAIGTSFEQAMMKSVRSIELGLDTMNLSKLKKLSDDEIRAKLSDVDDERSFTVFEALKRGVSVDEIHAITMIDEWFLCKLQNLVDIEKAMEAQAEDFVDEDLYLLAKHYGYTDEAIKRISGKDIKNPRKAVYKMVDTCAGEFAAQTPYFYSTYDDENEAAEFKAQTADKNKKTVIVFGSGPIRIGQGIEFDYCSVHCVWALKEMGYDAVICNNNPETVSTDFDTGDRLYFDPLTKEDVESLLATEKPYGVVVQFGGQTAIKLTKHLVALGANILGTSADSIDAAEDRERFDELLSSCSIPRPEGSTVMNVDEAVTTAARLGYPVLMRPSYVLGGQNMIIAHSEDDIREYMEIITRSKLENPVLIDKYMMGKEVEVDAICDGTDCLIPGIMEHVERAGVHSGDSISVYPAQTLTAKVRDTILKYTKKLAMALHVIGLVNIQYVVSGGEVYVIEVNPRSSRTVPYISKVTGVPMVDVATKIMLGTTLKEQGYEDGLYKTAKYIAVKVPVFSFGKLHDVDTELGPEMKSTGECLGIAENYEDAVFKGLVGAGYEFTKVGDSVLITVRDTDKKEVVYVAEKFERMGYKIYATSGTASFLNKNFVAANTVKRISEGHPNVMDLLDSGDIDYVVSTSAKGRSPALDSVKIRRKTVERSICCMTSMDTANAVCDILLMGKSIDDIEMVDITKI
jgi:carbamoyl-phosphate synthase large subunit